MSSKGRVFERRDRALAEVDEMSPDMRACVHAFGYPVVRACLQAGVSEPSRIKALVQEIWMGARSVTQKAGILNAVEWLSTQTSGETPRETVEVLIDTSMVLCPKHPTNAMIEASMATVANHDMRLTKREKHRLRLQAALDVARDEMQARRKHGRHWRGAMKAQMLEAAE